MPPSQICVARIGAAHGVRGAVKLWTFTEDPLAVTRYGQLMTKDGARQFEVTHVREAKGHLVATLKGIATREEAERLNGVELYVAREKLPETSEDEYYHADLIGLAAVDAAGEPLGRVIAIHNFGAGDIIEIAPPNGATMLLPFTNAVVPTVDLEGGRVVIELPDEIEGDDPSSVDACLSMAAETKPWRATVLSLFPDMFPGPLGVSLAGKALASGLWALEARDSRDSATDRHRSGDETPAGGGPGMVLRADVLADAIDAADIAPERPRLLMSPRGRPLTQAKIVELAAGPGPLIVCGRFEGVDQRVIEARRLEEISVGDYVLSGGEIAAMALIEACVRLLPGVMGTPASGVDESFSA